MELNKFVADIRQELKPYMEAAFAMAETAGNIHMRYFRTRNLQQSTKLNDSDVVTIADKESEAAILGYIREHFPDRFDAPDTFILNDLHPFQLRPRLKKWGLNCGDGEDTSADSRRRRHPR